MQTGLATLAKMADETPLRPQHMTEGQRMPVRQDVDNDRLDAIIRAYRMAKDAIIRAGFIGEITWQASVTIENTTESDFLREHAWVTLSTGMQERVIRNIFRPIASSFLDFQSAQVVVENKGRCRISALKRFNNQRKIDAIILTAERIFVQGFENFKECLCENPLKTLRSLPYIGPVTCFHLAKNIGVQVAKPDRHLTRLASCVGYDDVQLLCKDICHRTGDSVPVVDIVLWRFASITDGYINYFPSSNERAA